MIYVLLDEMAAQGGPGQRHVPVKAGPAGGVPHLSASDLHPAPARVHNGRAGTQKSTRPPRSPVSEHAAARHGRT